MGLSPFSVCSEVTPGSYVRISQHAGKFLTVDVRILWVEEAGVFLLEENLEIVLLVFFINACRSDGRNWLRLG